MGTVLDEVIDEYGMKAVGVRCWTEMQSILKISPCVVLSELNERGIPASCEVDVNNAVTMYALMQASGNPAACLDWNNNYGDEDDKCILFHCGAAPRSMMLAGGKVVDHAILANAVGEGQSYGPNVGRIASAPLTFASMTTAEGRPKFYIGEGRFTGEPIPQEFFGCGGVAQIENLQDVLLHVGRKGHRHHTSVTPAHVMEPVREALSHYLGFEVHAPQLV